VAENEEPIMREIRYLDHLIDKLTKGKTVEPASSGATSRVEIALRLISITGFVINRATVSARHPFQSAICQLSDGAISTSFWSALTRAAKYFARGLGHLHRGF
jgi:hypothetical protein